MEMFNGPFFVFSKYHNISRRSRLDAGDSSLIDEINENGFSAYETL